MQYFDLHCDTIYRCLIEKKNLQKNDLAISLERGNDAFDHYVQCFALWMPDEFRGEQAIEFYEKSRDVLIRELEKNNRFIKKIDSAQGLKSNFKTGAIMTVEGASALAGQIGQVERLYFDGVRIMTLTWNGANELGFGQQSGEGGLTAFGIETVAKMNELGMIVDVSHLNDDGFYDVARKCSRPFIATHSNSRSVCPHKRNLTDEQFKIIMECGGIVGLNFYTGFIAQEAEEAEKSEALFAHVAHFLELGGEDTLCIGSDFDGAEVPEYLNDLSCVPKLYDKMIKLGLDRPTADKIFYENSAKFFEKNLT